MGDLFGSDIVVLCCVCGERRETTDSLISIFHHENGVLRRHGMAWQVLWTFFGLLSCLSWGGYAWRTPTHAFYKPPVTPAAPCLLSSPT